jgi:hypothetical protein
MLMPNGRTSATSRPVTIEQGVDGDEDHAGCCEEFKNALDAGTGVRESGGQKTPTARATSSEEVELTPDELLCG